MTDILKKINAFYLLSDISISVYDRKKNELIGCTDASAGYFANNLCVSGLADNTSSCGNVFAVCGLSYGKLETDDLVLILGPVLPCRPCAEGDASVEGAPSGIPADDSGYVRHIPVVSDDALASYVLSLKFALADTQQGQPLQTGDEEGGDMSECIEYIAENMCDHKLTLENVAYHCGYNPSYLSRKFKRTFGMNFNRYLMNARLEKSADYLKNTGKSIAEIAADLYFSSQSHFQNAFKSVYGITPAEYRRQAA